MEIASRVKKARILAGYKRKQAADQLGLSVSGYAKKEDGQSRFYIDEIVVLGNMFGVDINEFFLK